MKIIHLNYSNGNGGAARAALRIHNSLRRMNIKSSLWVNHLWKEGCNVKGPKNKIEKIFNNLRPRIVNHTISKVIKTKNKNLLSPSVLPSRWVQMINSSNADIINLHWIHNEMLSIKDISRIKKPLVWTLHDMWAFCGAEHLSKDNRWLKGYYRNNRPITEFGFDVNRWTWNRKLKYWKKTFQIITPSKWLSDCVKKSKLMNNWPVETIPNPIDVKKWRPLNKHNSRKYFNLPQRANLIVFGAMEANIDKNKGFSILLSALKHISKRKKKTTNFEFVIFGVKKKIIINKINIPIHQVGYLDNDEKLQMIYSAADLIVVPSKQESFCQVASEAHSCATPVVAFNIGGLKDIIDHKKTGFLAKAYDSKDLVKGINWVLKNKQFINFRYNARNKVLKNFDEKLIARQYVKIYKKIMAKTRNKKISNKDFI